MKSFLVKNEGTEQELGGRGQKKALSFFSFVALLKGDCVIFDVVVMMEGKNQTSLRTW